jgi:segregation and condensation protein A
MTDEQFEPDDEGDRARWQGGQLVVDLDGYEGPLDVLLALAREQKVDLARISILQLADQYLSFIERARELSLEIAADYLVMAAWLAYLKSRLLLPEPPTDEPSGEEIAEALAFQLRSLEAMRAAGGKLMGRSLLGRDVFARGAPEGVRTITHPIYELSYFDLLRAYADHRRRIAPGRLTVEHSQLHTIDQAIRRLTRLLGGSRGWQTLASFLPPGIGPSILLRSALSATFAASLELARQGRVSLRQTSEFAPIYLRARGDAR